jgi:hypothetical protein
MLKRGKFPPVGCSPEGTVRCCREALAGQARRLGLKDRERNGVDVTGMLLEVGRL